MPRFILSLIEEEVFSGRFDKKNIYELINELVKNGKGIIYALCEFPEILGLTNRIYIMYDGKIVKELKSEDTNEDEPLFYSTFLLFRK